MHEHGFVLIGLAGPMDVVKISLSLPLSLICTIASHNRANYVCVVILLVELNAFEIAALSQDLSMTLKVQGLVDYVNGAVPRWADMSITWFAQSV